jgi:hypothetical protein
MSLDTDWDDSDDNADGGTTNDSQPVTVPPDPSGGTGAIDPTFLDSATNGLSASLGSGFAQQIGSLVGLAAVNAAGSLVYKATAGSTPQAAPVPVAQPATSSISPTMILIGIAAVVLLFVIVE